MRFLLDHDVYAATGRFLGELGHDVVAVAKLGLAQGSDAELLSTAHAQNRVFVTRDRDFGGLVFVQDFGAGVIYECCLQLKMLCIKNLPGFCRSIPRMI